MKSARQLLLTALALSAAIGSAAAADLVIVESTTPQLRAGQVISATAPLTLAAGSRIAVVGEDGKVTRLEGPFSGVPIAATAAAGDKGVVQAVSRLFAEKGPATTSWGTFRGVETGDEAANPPQVWAVNLLRTENVCVPAGVEPVLWRPDASQPMSVILLHLSTGREGTIELDAGQQAAPWPPALKLLDGGEYAIRDAGNTWERRLFVRLIPADRASAVQQVTWMSDAGCFRQAKALLTQVVG